MKKRSSFFIISLITCITINGCWRSNESKKALELNRNWRFKLGDQKQWALASTDDSKWDTVAVGHLSAGKVFDKYNGYGWYRIKINLFGSWIQNKKSPRPDSIKFSFGAIDDCDEVYLNGMLIGANNKVLPQGSNSDSSFINAKSLWNIPRRYMLSIKDKRILWDKENVIAIRVFDQYGGGGIYSEVPKISKYSLEDYVDVDLDNFYKIKENEYVKREITIKNRSENLLVSGDLKMIARDFEKDEVVFQIKSGIKLNPGETKTLFVKLPNSTDPLIFFLTITDDDSREVLSVRDSIPYVLVP